MRVIVDRGRLRVQSEPGDRLHEEAFPTWREADVLFGRVRNESPSNIDELGAQLADTSTHALAAGRDNSVIDSFLEVERKLRSSGELLRNSILEKVFRISAVVFLIGLALGVLWIWAKANTWWSAFPRGFDLAANWIFVIIGWSGFTMVGFAFGWLFFQTATLRVAAPPELQRLSNLLSHTRAQVIYIGTLCVILNFFLFFFDGFEKINDSLSAQLNSAPWAILLGLAAGILEPTLFTRMRAALKFI